MFKCTKVIALAMMSFNLLFAAFESHPTSTANMAFGRINMNFRGNILNIISDPSSIVNYNMKGGEAVWGRPFQLKELQQTAFATSFMYKNWGFGASASTFGNKIYNESMLVFSVAKVVRPRLSLGVNIILYQLKITDYGTAHAPGVSASMRYNISDHWDWISTVRNINAPNIGASKDELPQIFSTGFVGKIHKMFTIAAEWEQDIAYKGAVKFGVAFTPLKQLSLLTGYVSDPGQFTAGISININKIYFEYGTIAYNDLGLFTHQLGIGVNFNRR